MNKSLSLLSIEALETDGFELILPVSDITLIKQVLSELSTAFSASHGVSVNADNIVMRTLNGDDLIGLCPSVKIIYQDVISKIKQKMPEVNELEDNTIGISANFLSGNNDRFRLHFDRNQLTVVIYLNDADSFPLILYPNIREDPASSGIKEKFDLKTAKSETVFPKQNLAVVFYGRRTFHGVSNSNTDYNEYKKRYSLQFAFDFDISDYSNRYYYGKSNSK
jgi:hypothetical protein